MIFWLSQNKINSHKAECGVSISWDSATCGVWVGPGHIGGWGADLTVTMEAVFPQGMPHHAASIGFMLSWLPQLLSLKAIWIFWESFQTQPSYLLGNRKHLGFWNWAPLPDRSRCSSSVGLEAHLSPSSLVWSPSVPLFFPWKAGQAERFADEYQGVNVDFLILTHWLPFSFRAEQ